MNDRISAAMALSPSDFEKTSFLPAAMFGAIQGVRAIPMVARAAGGRALANMGGSRIGRAMATRFAGKAPAAFAGGGGRMYQAADRARNVLGRTGDRIVGAGQGVASKIRGGSFRDTVNARVARGDYGRATKRHAAIDKRYNRTVEQLREARAAGNTRMAERLQDRAGRDFGRRSYQAQRGGEAEAALRRSASGVVRPGGATLDANKALRGRADSVLGKGPPGPAPYAPTPPRSGGTVGSGPQPINTATNTMPKAGPPAGAKPPGQPPPAGAQPPGPAPPAAGAKPPGPAPPAGGPPGPSPDAPAAPGKGFWNGIKSWTSANPTAALAGAGMGGALFMPSMSFGGGGGGGPREVNQYGG